MATLVRFREPFREFAALQNEMGRLMNGMLEGNGRTNQAWVPAVDVWETDEEVVYAFDLPGIAEDEISVELDDNALTVTAERERRPCGRPFYGPTRVPASPARASSSSSAEVISVSPPARANPRAASSFGRIEPAASSGKRDSAWAGSSVRTASSDAPPKSR